MKVILPYRSEFGFNCMVHAPQANAVRGPKVICLEPGMEALYPGAVRYWQVYHRHDVERRVFLEEQLLAETEAILRKEYPDAEFIRPDHKATRRYFVPRPTVRKGIECDVVVCPRARDYGSSKNLQAWPAIIDALKNQHGLRVFAGGAPDSSDTSIECDAAWKYTRHLDATIEAMASAKLVVATDNGLAHLAMMVGTPLLLISYKDGIVAPGADDMGKPYWPIKIERFYEANHCRVNIEILKDSWDKPAMVALRAAELIE